MPEFLRFFNSAITAHKKKTLFLGLLFLTVTGLFGLGLPTKADAAKPTITSVSPETSQVTNLNQEVTITLNGTNFRNDPPTVQVRGCNYWRYALCQSTDYVTITASKVTHISDNQITFKFTSLYQHGFWYIVRVGNSEGFSNDNAGSRSFFEIKNNGSLTDQLLQSAVDTIIPAIQNIGTGIIASLRSEAPHWLKDFVIYLIRGTAYVLSQICYYIALGSSEVFIYIINQISKDL